MDRIEGSGTPSPKGNLESRGSSSSSESAMSALDSLSRTSSPMSLEEWHFVELDALPIYPGREATARAILDGPKTEDQQMTLRLLRRYPPANVTSDQLRTALRSTSELITAKTKEQAIYLLAGRGELTLPDLTLYHKLYPREPIQMLTYLALTRGEPILEASDLIGEKRDRVLQEVFETEESFAFAIDRFSKKYPEFAISGKLKPFQTLISAASREPTEELQQRALLQALQTSEFFEYYTTIVDYVVRYYDEIEPATRGADDGKDAITGVQRLPRWKMLLGELSKRTPAESPLSKATTNAAARLGDAVTHLNEVLRTAEATA